MILNLLAIGFFASIISTENIRAENSSFAHQLFGSQSMVAPLKKVLVRRPDASFAVTDLQKWHYTAAPDLAAAQQEHDSFVDTLKKEGVEVLYHSTLMPEHADAIFVHDPVIVTNKGAIILKMGKALRRGEEDAIQATLDGMGIPTWYKLHGDATAEGGDTL